MSPAHTTNPVFDCLFDEAVPAILGGDHRQDEPPVDGGRWPVSVVCLPDRRTRELLAGVMDEALVHAGPGHFETGREDASHFTIRALEPYREAASPADGITQDWIAALDGARLVRGPVAGARHLVLEHPPLRGARPRCTGTRALGRRPSRFPGT